jgi:hypothetical protein
MFSVITNIYNKETKGPILTEFFTATGKLNLFLTIRDVRCVHHGWHGTHRYGIQVLATHVSTWVHRYSSLLQWSVPLGQRVYVTMMGRIPGLWHIPKEKNHRALCQGTSGVITSVVGHFQTHALSNVLVTPCSGTDEPHSGMGGTSVLLEYERRCVLQLSHWPRLRKYLSLIYEFWSSDGGTNLICVLWHYDFA